MYQVIIDRKIVLTTNNHRIAFARLKAEVKWAKKNIVGTRKVSLRITL